MLTSHNHTLRKKVDFSTKSNSKSRISHSKNIFSHPNHFISCFDQNAELHIIQYSANTHTKLGRRHRPMRTNRAHIGARFKDFFVTL